MRQQMSMLHRYIVPPPSLNRKGLTVPRAACTVSIAFLPKLREKKFLGYVCRLHWMRAAFLFFPPRSSQLPCCRQARLHGARRHRLGRRGRCSPCPAYYCNRPGLRCAATRFSWLLMVSRHWAVDAGPPLPPPVCSPGGGQGVGSSSGAGSSGAAAV